jgi:MYXO-CTERM domain-containing protein
MASDDAEPTRDAGSAPSPADDGCGCRASAGSGALGLAIFAILASRRRTR